MPKKDYVSLTLRKSIYDINKKRYLANKSKLEMKGITSFSGYVAYVLSTAKMYEVLND